MIGSYRHRRSKRGYTAVEVLISMTLFAVGAAGVIAMQRVSIQGNADARRADVATGIANTWIARLRRDSMTWTQPNAFNPTSNHSSNTVWLGVVLGPSPPPLAQNTGWLLPAIPAGGPIGGTSSFDIFGREVPIATPVQHLFCVNYRLDWLQLDTTMRAEVRVFWPRLEESASPTCLPATAAAGGQPVFHFVYATTTLRRNAT